MIIAKKILKITCIVLGVILAAAIIFVGVLTLTEYKPGDSESLEVSSGSTFGQNTTGSDKLSPSVGDPHQIFTYMFSKSSGFYVFFNRNNQPMLLCKPVQHLGI